MRDFLSILQFKKVNCKNCYKCVRYCPVKAIRVRDHQAQIIESQCILCEKCTIVCPQDAKVEQNQVPEIKAAMEHGDKLIASVHPAYLAKFGITDFAWLSGALKQLGFAEAYEASEGAYLMKKEYEKVLLQRGGRKLTISSSCPVIVQLIEKHYPELMPNLAPVLSVMQTHGKYLKESHPDARIVYVSPCISAMAEMTEPENHVDYVITLQELSEWMEKEQLPKEENREKGQTYLSRAAALPDGLILSMHHQEGQRYLPINGIDTCKSVLKELQGGGFEDCFIEMNACVNGCIAGPSFQKEERGLLADVFAVRNAALIQGHAEPGRDYNIDSDLCLMRKFGIFAGRKEELASEEKIRDILAKMGKFSVKDELNCGACGYNTCREKAIAIIQNKAEAAMCIPYMRARQEDYSNKVFNAMPGLLVTVDYDLRIVQMNQAAVDLFDIQRKKEMIGRPVSEIMDDYSLTGILSFDRNLMQDEIYLEEQDRYLDRVMTNDRENRMILCIMKDVTKERMRHEKIHRAQMEAARLADSLVEEQLKIVHQIAGLLGETAADTKVAVEELKNTILMESGQQNEKK